MLLLVKDLRSFLLPYISFFLFLPPVVVQHFGSSQHQQRPPTASAHLRLARRQHLHASRGASLHTKSPSVPEGGGQLLSLKGHVGSRF